jgi:hypothetical protein
MAFFDKVNGDKCVVAIVMREENIATTKKMNNKHFLLTGICRVPAGRVGYWNLRFAPLWRGYEYQKPTRNPTRAGLYFRGNFAECH